MNELNTNKNKNYICLLNTYRQETQMPRNKQVNKLKVFKHWSTNFQIKLNFIHTVLD